MTSVVDMLNRAHIEVRERGANVGRGFVGIDCIFCGESRKHLGVNIDEAFFNCWICGEKGPYWRLARKLKSLYPSIPWHEVDVGKATRYIDVEYAKLRPEVEGSTASFSSWDPDMLTDYEFGLWEYLYDERHLERELIEYLEPLVGLNGPHENDAKLRGYVCFRYGDDVVARKISDHYRGPRYWRSFAGGALWGLEYLRSAPEWVVVCEGVFDALAVPLGRGLAILGSVASPDWIGLLAEKLPRSCRDVVLAFDSGVALDSPTISSLRLQLADLGLTVHVWDWEDSRFDDAFEAADECDLDEWRLLSGRAVILDYLLELVGVLDGDLDRPLL